ncbi:MAG TPA: aminotransferase class I/II-fold pyridoxal phosphate-dependent enzyme [Vicinamibacteria bacterium]|nr:aminotransferase class I/II-fold pyridoxal phosphate-dependent enzyme [Vicinamibacteria bacterium]
MSDTVQAAAAGAQAPAQAARVSRMAQALVGSEILRIAGEIRSLVASGHAVCDLTVGDFSPRHFPIPPRLADGVRRALEQGETNYPPSSGMADLRQAVRRFYARELRLDYPVESILVAGGSRPLIYGVFRTLCDPGDRVVYAVPSWNNNHYVHLSDTVPVPVVCTPEERFLPTAARLRPELAGARLLCLNSPLNPSGTTLEPEALRAIGQAVLEENRRRQQGGQRPLYVLYDQVYWMLRFGSAPHPTPPGLLPDLFDYTVLVDGISKAFAATGLRVGWAAGPADIMSRLSAVLGHVGAWAPRAEQVATAALLDDTEGVREFQEGFLAGLRRRLDALHAGMQALQAAGLPVQSMAPMGAIYLATRIHPFGRRTAAGAVLRTNEDIRRFLLEVAGLAVVPFQAFGSTQDEGWFRLSVGAVGEDDIRQALPRLEQALRSLR